MSLSLSLSVCVSACVCALSTQRGGCPHASPAPPESKAELQAFVLHSGRDLPVVDPAELDGLLLAHALLLPALGALHNLGKPGGELAQVVLGLLAVLAGALDALNLPPLEQVVDDVDVILGRVPGDVKKRDRREKS